MVGTHADVAGGLGLQLTRRVNTRHGRVIRSDEQIEAEDGPTIDDTGVE